MTKGDSLYAVPRDVQSVDQCHFYHAMEIPGAGLVGSEWDLRADTAAYLGGVNFKGKRVLEIGPATGFLTFYMEAQGAEVVCIDTDESQAWDFVPHFAVVNDEYKRKYREHVTKMKNGFWFAHRAFKSRAKVYYGDATRLPSGLGIFDVAVLANVLVHCRDAMGVLCSAAEITTGTVVVTEGKVIDSDHPLALLRPSGKEGWADTWWTFSPQLFVNMLQAMNFQKTSVTSHSQRGVPTGEMYPMYTVVGERQWTSLR